MFKFQTCLQNVSKAVWDYCCVRWQLVLKVKRYKNEDQFDQAHRNQWWLSIPKKALLTKPRSPTLCWTGINFNWGPGWESQHSWMCTSGIFSSFLAFGGNVWWPLLWWPSYETRVKSQHSPVHVLPLGLHPGDLSR